ncbi:MAG TPA: hypothetical protein VFP72_14980 [Kineosporiaceae bacterium]|nr:hypothetical protein [Kineosporiaceae bacterium]
MARRKPHRPAGRPGLLTPDVEKQLIDATRAGAPVHAAAAAVGLSQRAVFRWLQRGHDELEARDEGRAPDPDEQQYVDLWVGVEKARAQATVRAVANIQRCAAGGIVTEETTRRYRDPDTGEMVEETTVKKTAPDWRASAWYLERQQRADFGRQAELAVTGPGGGPVQVEHAVDVESLAARIHGALQRLELPGADEDSDQPDVTVDVEVLSSPGR